MIRFLTVLIALWSSAFTPAIASAHTRSLSYSSWREDGNRLEMVFRAPWIEFRRAVFSMRNVSLIEINRNGEVQDSVRAYVLGHLRAIRGETPCTAPTLDLRSEMESGMVVGTWAVSCTGGSGLSVEWDLFFDAAPSHVHVARWIGDGTMGKERESILTTKERVWRPVAESTSEPSRTGIGGFLRLGFTHILSGYDHLLFLAGFLLLGLPLRRLIGLITAFTVAHSLSLAAATLGWVRPTAPAVESLIGFSIAIIALDGFGKPGQRSSLLVAGISILVGWLFSLTAGGAMPALAWLGLIIFAMSYFRLQTARSNVQSNVLAQWLVVFMFGLVHGFGFAGALISAQFEKGQVLRSLLGFNIGVELGQLGVLTILLVAARLLSRLNLRVAQTQYACASVLLAMGLFWFWSRLVG